MANPGTSGSPDAGRAPRRPWLLSADKLLIAVGVALLGAALVIGVLQLCADRAAGKPAQPVTVPTDALASSSSDPRWPALLQAIPATPTVGATAETTASAPITHTDHPRATSISIPSIGIDTKIEEVGYDIVTVDGQRVIQWRVADYAASHDEGSANPGDGGNIVITGHDDWRGEVFKNLEHVKVGDQVVLTTADGQHRYAVSQILYRLEVGAPLSERLATGRYLGLIPDERVTLVTCWPYGIDDHRLIVIATPLTDGAP